MGKPKRRRTDERTIDNMVAGIQRVKEERAGLERYKEDFPSLVGTGILEKLVKVGNSPNLNPTEKILGTVGLCEEELKKPLTSSEEREIRQLSGFLKRELESYKTSGRRFKYRRRNP